MAPYAQIVLVEAKSSSFSDLLYAVDVATNIVKVGGYVASGGAPAVTAGEVSMSWGGSEFRGETSYDVHFNNNLNVVYFAASGDSGGQTIYPSTSRYVVSAGGTTLTFSGSTFTEKGWSGSGGGPSKYEGRPAYQNGIVKIVGSARGTPDFSFDADPNSGVSVYDSYPCGGMSGWMVFGGTSVSSPSLSGIVNAAAHFYTGSSELNTIYSDLGTSYVRDITSGKAGKFSAAKGWDFVTGVGSDLTLAGK
jgi:kumamolisin